MKPILRRALAAAPLVVALWPGTLPCVASPHSAGAQQAAAPDTGCVQTRDGYTCNWASFLPAFERAHTARAEAAPQDRNTLRQLHELLGQLGKTPAPPDQPADLTLVLTSVDPTGVDLGPMAHDLATLRVYAPAAPSENASPHGPLLWVETLRGSGDRPWPAQVHALIQQFQARFKGQH